MSEINFIKIPSGKFLMGANTPVGHPLDRELPQIEVEIEAFEISETTITNGQFQKFVEKTGYVTTAEKFGGSFVFHLLLDDTLKKTSQMVPGTEWWRYVEGANWKNPFGPNSTIDDILDHPVVHISFVDALEFCKHYGYLLPNESEWEYAARGGSNFDFPWGEEFLAEDKWRCNIFQGDFPFENTLEDGYLGTAPAKSFEPNSFGLYNVIGNVWEWCANKRGIDLTRFVNSSFTDLNTLSIDEFDDTFEVATKGGSFLCHFSYCNRYRLGARNGNYPLSTTSNCGFRVIRK